MNMGERKIPAFDANRTRPGTCPSRSIDCDHRTEESA